jgi:hypothetical protein
MPSRSQVIHARRQVLQNPYAFLEELEEEYELRSARRLSENPYAYAEQLLSLSDPVQRFDSIATAQPQPSEALSVRRKQRYSDKEIEKMAREQQLLSWARNAQSNAKTNPLDVLDPCDALKALGFDFYWSESLGYASSSEGSFKVAGIIDYPRKRVDVSSLESLAVRNFTAAHELGHAVLHDGIALHRDRPLDGTRLTRDQREREADRFASYFLMPEKLIRTVFLELFGLTRFALNEHSRFALFGNSTTSKERSISLRQLSLSLASTSSFNGRRFTSIADQFRVSVKAMAIRIEELSLVSVTNEE